MPPTNSPTHQPHLSTGAAEGRDTSRSPVLSLVRAAGVALVLLGQAWFVVFTDQLTRFAPLDGLFGSMELGWTLLWVGTGFAVVEGLLHAERSGQSGTAVVWRHLGWVVLAVVSCLVAVAVVATFSSAGGTAPVTGALQHVLSFTWNWALLENPALGRLDLVSLRYFSIEVQALLVVVLVHVLLRHQPRWRVLAGVVGVVAATIWSADLVHGGETARAMLETWTRGSAVLWGALAAWCRPWFTRRQPWAASLSSAALLPLLWLPFLVSFTSVGESVSVMLPLTAGLAAVALVGDGGGLMAAERLGSHRVVVAVARRWWLLVALWGPVALGTAEGASRWPGWLRLVLALVVLAVAVALVEKVVAPGLLFLGRFGEAVLRPVQQGSDGAGGAEGSSAQVGDEERGAGGDQTPQP